MLIEFSLDKYKFINKDILVYEPWAPIKSYCFKCKKYSELYNFGSINLLFLLSGKKHRVNTLDGIYQIYIPSLLFYVNIFNNQMNYASCTCKYINTKYDVDISVVATTVQNKACPLKFSDNLYSLPLPNIEDEYVPCTPLFYINLNQTKLYKDNEYTLNIINQIVTGFFTPEFNTDTFDIGNSFVRSIIDKDKNWKEVLGKEYYLGDKDNNNFLDYYFKKWQQMPNKDILNKELLWHKVPKYKVKSFNWTDFADDY